MPSSSWSPYHWSWRSMAHSTWYPLWYLHRHPISRRGLWRQWGPGHLHAEHQQCRHYSDDPAKTTCRSGVCPFSFQCWRTSMVAHHSCHHHHAWDHTRSLCPLACQNVLVGRWRAHWTGDHLVRGPTRSWSSSLQSSTSSSSHVDLPHVGTANPTGMARHSPCPWTLSPCHCQSSTAAHGNGSCGSHHPCATTCWHVLYQPSDDLWPYHPASRYYSAARFDHAWAHFPGAADPQPWTHQPMLDGRSDSSMPGLVWFNATNPWHPLTGSGWIWTRFALQHATSCCCGHGQASDSSESKASSWRAPNTWAGGSHPWAATASPNLSWGAHRGTRTSPTSGALQDLMGRTLTGATQRTFPHGWGHGTWRRAGPCGPASSDACLPNGSHWQFFCVPMAWNPPEDQFHYLYVNPHDTDAESAFLHMEKRPLHELDHMQLLHRIGYTRAVILDMHCLRSRLTRILYHNNSPALEHMISQHKIKRANAWPSEQATTRVGPMIDLQHLQRRTSSMVLEIDVELIQDFFHSATDLLCPWFSHLDLPETTCTALASMPHRSGLGGARSAHHLHRRQLTRAASKATSLMGGGACQHWCMGFSCSRRTICQTRWGGCPVLHWLASPQCSVSCWHHSSFGYIRPGIGACRTWGYVLGRTLAFGLQ